MSHPHVILGGFVLLLKLIILALLACLFVASGSHGATVLGGMILGFVLVMIVLGLGVVKLLT